MNWIQKYALGVLMRHVNATLKEMRPQGVDANLFSYHIHYLKSHDIIESVSRGTYRLTVKGMHVAGKFNSETGTEVEDVKTVIILYAHDGDNILTFQWSRHPYLGATGLPHDRYNYGASLEEALTEAVQDKLHSTLEHSRPRYVKSGMIHIRHDEKEVSCMSAHVFMVDASAIEAPLVTRNGMLSWTPKSELQYRPNVMQPLNLLVESIESPEISIFDISLTY